MFNDNLISFLKFYFITDCSNSANLSVIDQAKLAISVGATTIQYRNKNFKLSQYADVQALKHLCNQNEVMFIINDDVLLAKAVEANGIHLGQDDEDIFLVREIMGSDVVIGLSVSTLDELNKYRGEVKYDYVGVGPIFETKTKLDAKPPQGLKELQKISKASLVPSVAIGGINSTNAKLCIKHGAVGVAIISYITRSENPINSALVFARNYSK